MPKPDNYIRVTNEPPDGNFHIGDTVQFEASDGVISINCIDATGERLLGAGLRRGDHDWTVGVSQSWAADPVPLTCTANLIDSVNGRIRTLASVEFDLLP